MVKQTTKIKKIFQLIEVYERLFGDARKETGNFGVNKASAIYNGKDSKVEKVIFTPRKHVNNGVCPGDTSIVLDEDWDKLETVAFLSIYETKVWKLARWMLENGVSSNEALNSHLDKLAYVRNNKGEIIKNLNKPIYRIKKDEKGNFVYDAYKRPVYETDVKGNRIIADYEPLKPRYDKISLSTSTSGAQKVLMGLDSIETVLHNDLEVKFNKAFEKLPLEEQYIIIAKVGDVLEKFVEQDFKVNTPNGKFDSLNPNDVEKAKELSCKEDYSITNEIASELFGLPLMERAIQFDIDRKEKAKEERETLKNKVYTINDNSQYHYATYSEPDGMER